MVKYLVMDVDGTLTDGKVYMGSEGEVIKAFNIKDGYGIHDLLPRYGIVPVIITGRQSGIVMMRCKELGVKHVFQGVTNKLGQLGEITQSFHDVAYIGDDLNDLPCMLSVLKSGGITACPCDAVGQVKAIASYVTPHKGGDGAVRDFIDWLIANGV